MSFIKGVQKGTQRAALLSKAHRTPQLPTNCLSYDLSLPTIGRDMLFCVHNECRGTQHPIWRTKEERLFKEVQQGSGGWEVEACTPPLAGALLGIFGGLCSVSRLVSKKPQLGKA